MNGHIDGILTREETLAGSITVDTPVIKSVISGVGKIGSSASANEKSISVTISSFSTYGATANPEDILVDKKAVGNGEWLYGSMPENKAQISSIDNIDDRVVIANGHHNGEGYVEIVEEERRKVIPGNIKKDVSLLGVLGEYEGEEVFLQEKNATPSSAKQVVEPDSNYDYLSKVVVEPIPYREEPNEYGTSVYIC